MRNVVIIGGGLAGLISGIELSKKGVPCRLFEKKEFPFHRVCGEYISNEAAPFLKETGLFPEKLSPSFITQFQLSSIRGQSATLPLDMGGFSISRFSFDNFLFEKAKESGVIFHLNTEVEDVSCTEKKFQIRTATDQFEADVVIGAFGKRSKLDKNLQRDFISKRSPYIGIKYHAKTDHPDGLVSLHNFAGGYCGVVNVENKTTNICYLAKRDALQQYRTIGEMEKNILHKNPILKELFTSADLVFEKPLVINEISFKTKAPVEKHILMAGDAAGMIAPLCGNGMAMAIHSAKILSELVMIFCEGRMSHAELEMRYEKQWRSIFANRLLKGRIVQKLFGNDLLSKLAVGLTMHSKPVSKLIMRQTHGHPF